MKKQRKPPKKELEAVFAGSPFRVKTATAVVGVVLRTV